MKKQSGFTLIEIVMVLVLLGILTAVAVPKYFDLQEEAAKKAAATFAAEYQAQLNANFAKGLLDNPENKSCSDIATAAKTAVETNNTDLFNASGNNGVTASELDGSTIKLTIKVKGYTSTAGEYTARMPQCN